MDGQELAQLLIATELEQQTGELDLGDLGLTELPASLFELQHLHTLSLGSGWHDGNGRWLRGGHRLGSNRLLSLARLESLKGLRALNLCQLPEPDLVGIGQVTQLRRLDCRNTGLRDLQPLQGLVALQVLLLGTGGRAGYQSLEERPVVELSPLSALSTLRLLTLRGLRMAGLEPLAGMLKLRALDLAESSASCIKPLSSLLELQSLCCSCTRVSDLAPLSPLIM